jgi:hypothetical protein
VFIVAGLQEPVMEFVEVLGRAGAAEFLHSGPIWVNRGSIDGGITTIVMVLVVAHRPAEGVNV